MTHELTNWLQDWAKTQADGDWEHEMGVTIAMIDNPGWNFNADLVNYEKKLQDIPYTLIENGDNDWMGYKVHDAYFNIAGDLGKLSQIISFFRSTIIHLDGQAGHVKLTQDDLSCLLHRALKRQDKICEGGQPQQ